MKTVIIDNYDSFTYNLKHAVNELGIDVDVLRNDAFDIESIAQYDKIILSPGPGDSSGSGTDAGRDSRNSGEKSILG